MLLDERLFEDYIDCEKTPKGKKSKAGFAGDPTANMTRDEYIDWLITVKGYNKKNAESTANMFYESLKEDSDTKEDLIETLSNKFWYISKLANNSASGIINYPEEFAKCNQRVSRMSRELKDIIYYMQKLGDDSLSESLNEDFDDVVDIQLPNSDEEIVIPTAPEVATIPTGPKTGEEIGQSSMLLDAIAACAKTIDNYNIIKTNLTDPKMIEVVEGIASQETNILGKLQGLLKEVSPNASEIMYGATDAEAALTESFDEEDMEYDDSIGSRNLKSKVLSKMYAKANAMLKNGWTRDDENELWNMAYSYNDNNDDEIFMCELAPEDAESYNQPEGSFGFMIEDDPYFFTEDLDEEDMKHTNLDSSYLEHLDPMTGKLKVEAWAPPVEQSDVNDMATANMPDMIIPDDLDVDDDFEDPEEI